MPKGIMGNGDRQLLDWSKRHFISTEGHSTNTRIWCFSFLKHCRRQLRKTKLVSQQLILDSNPFSSLTCMILLLSVRHHLIIKSNCRLLKFLFVRFGLSDLIRCCTEHLNPFLSRSNLFKQNHQHEIKTALYHSKMLLRHNETKL